MEACEGIRKNVQVGEGACVGMQLRSHRGPKQQRNLNENAGVKWEGVVSSHSLDPCRCPASPRQRLGAPAAPTTRPHPGGMLARNNQGLRADQSKKKIFFSGAVFVSFFVYSNVLHLLCFLFWNELIAASLKVKTWGPPVRVPDWPGTEKNRDEGSIPLCLPTGPCGPTAI